MSSTKGNIQRTRPQKYQNRTAFKNTLYDSSDYQKKLNNLNVSEVCMHCKGVIEWKIKYKKYKPLSQPKTCVKCSQKTVKKAYHVMCRECALNAKVCAKCLKCSEEVEIIPPEPTAIEQQKLKVEMDKLIKSFPERKRRSFLRYMRKGKKIENDDASDIAENDKDEKQIEKEEKAIKKKIIPHSRDDLLKKIEELQLNENDEDDFNFTDDDENDVDNDADENDNEWSDTDDSEDEKHKKKL